MRNKIGLALLAALILIQFYRPDIQAPQPLPAEVDLYQVYQDAPSLIRVACYDCHSYEAILPWYEKVNPAGILIRRHILEGREHLNFSTFGTLKDEERREYLAECAKELEGHNMPLKAYNFLHPEARLNARERADLVQWFRTQARS